MTRLLQSGPSLHATSSSLSFSSDPSLPPSSSPSSVSPPSPTLPARRAQKLTVSRSTAFQFSSLSTFVLPDYSTTFSFRADLVGSAFFIRSPSSTSPRSPCTVSSPVRDASDLRRRPSLLEMLRMERMGGTMRRLLRRRTERCLHRGRATGRREKRREEEKGKEFLYVTIFDSICFLRPNRPGTRDAW